MNQHSLNELEAAMLKKRLKFLRAEGATGKPTYGLGDDFFKQMEDHWTFCSALADIYAVKEMGDSRRDNAVAATLPSSLEEDRDDDDDEAIETGDLLARLVVNELLSDEDTHASWKSGLIARMYKECKAESRSFHPPEPSSSCCRSR